MRKQQIHISGSLMDLLARKARESRAIRILLEGIERVNLGIETDTGAPAWPGSRIIRKELIGDFFTFREKKGMISYMPAGREQWFTEDGTWALKGRQATSPGKWIRSMLSEEVIRKLRIKDDEFAALATAVKYEELAGNLSFEEVPIREAYKHSNFRQPPPDSCMWDSPVSEFYDLFDTAAVVCKDGNGEFRARAIVWRGVIVGNTTTKPVVTITFMDRIYADSEEVTEAMRHHARASGWHHKARQCRGSCSIVSPEGDELSVVMKVESSDSIEALFYPYLDTFTSGSDHTLTSGGGGEYGYNNTNGTREGDNEHDGMVCDAHGNWIDEDDAVEVDGEYYSADSDEIVYCDCVGEYRFTDDCVEIDDAWYPRHSRWVVYSDAEGEYLRKENAVQVDGDWYPSDSEDIVWSDHESKMLVADDAVQVEGNWYSYNSDIIVEIDGEWYLKRDCEEVDGEWYLRESLIPTEDGWLTKDKWDENQLPLGVVVDGEIVKGQK